MDNKRLLELAGIQLNETPNETIDQKLRDLKTHIQTVHGELTATKALGGTVPASVEDALEMLTNVLNDFVGYDD